MQVWTVEIIEGNIIEQIVGPFDNEDAAKDWIEDNWGEYPTDEARTSLNDEEAIDTDL